MASFIHAVQRRIRGETSEQPLALRQQGSSSLSVRRYSVLDRPANATLERQSTADRELFTSMFQTIRLNEQMLISLEKNEEQLAKENIVLRAQVIELTMTLEQGWLVRGKNVAMAISTLFHKFQGLHSDLSTKNTEAQRIIGIRKQCFLNNEYTQYTALMEKELGTNHMVLSHVSDETGRWHFFYSHTIGRFLAPIEQLYKTFGDTFPIAVKASIQKIKEEMLHETPPQELTQLPLDVVSLTSLPSAEASQMTRFQQNSAIDSAFHTVEHEQTDASLALNYRILQMQGVKEGLEKKKNDLNNMEARFLDCLQSELDKGFSPKGIDKDFHFSAKNMIKRCENDTKDYLQRLKELSPHLGKPSFWMEANSAQAAVYQIGLELAKQISSEAQKMDQLVSEIEKGCPAPEPTT